VTDSLALEAVDRHLRGRFGKPYRYEDACESTQLLLGPDDPEGAVAVADYQTAGRGRLGRTWQAPPGTSIHCSIALHPPPQRSAPELTLVGALAAAEAIEVVTTLAAQIKWPNDVMLNRRKVAGVLGELRGGVVVLGIGINVGQTRAQLPPDARQQAGSLRTVTGSTYDRADLLGSLLFRLERIYDEWRHGGVEDLFVEIGPRDFLRGRRVTVDGVEGLAEGIDREGRLLVAGRRIESGEVEYER
jgi:BirA family biotin operon repressor/biotin-[acetyl-CoA-carboxylase] ligase